ncbi:DUF4136 domain-containing protein [Curvivirga sp.]|uniref:DUF4136 domain-containing protein n=1 Tax=Curvivirga sp. TaxID=2856848 RepID=UPI003B59977A
MFRFLAISSLLFIAACARLTGDVQSFSEITEDDKTKTLIVHAFPEELRSSLEYKTYKQKLENHLSGQGFQIVQDEQEADLIAFFNYGINDGIEIKDDSYGYPSVTFGGGYGSGGGGHVSTRYTIPIYTTGASTNRTYDSYTRKIALDIVVKDSLENEAGPTVLYEGRLRSKGRCGVLSEVMDEMLTLLFEKFPDQSGKASIKQEADC